MKLITLVLVNGLTPFILCTMVPAMPGIAARFGGDSRAVVMAQVLLVVPFFAQMIGPPIVGRIVTRFGRLRPLLFALPVLCLAGASAYWLESFWALFASRLISGFAIAATATIAPTLAGDYFSGRQQDRAVAWLGIADTAGSMLVLLIAGLLARVGGWHLPFIMFLLAIPVMVLVAVVLDEPVWADQQAMAASKERLPGELILLAFWMVIAGIGMILSSVQLPFLLIDLGTTDPSVASTILGTGAIAATAGAAAYPLLKSRLPQPALMALPFLLMGAAYVGAGLVHQIPVIWALMLMMSVGSGLVFPLFTRTAMQIVEAGVLPRAMGLIIGAMFGGWLLTPFVAGPLRTRIGDAGVFMSIGACLCLAGLVSIVQSRRHLAPSGDGLRAQ